MVTTASYNQYSTHLRAIAGMLGGAFLHASAAMAGDATITQADVEQSRGMSAHSDAFSGGGRMGITPPPVQHPIKMTTITTRTGSEITVPADDAEQALAAFEEFEMASTNSLMSHMLPWREKFQGTIDPKRKYAVHLAVAEMQSQNKIPVLSPEYFYGFLGIENPWLESDRVNAVTGACGLSQMKPSTQLQMMAEFPHMFPEEYRGDLNKVERVVSGHDEQNRAIFAFDVKQGYDKQDVIDLCKQPKFGLYLANAYGFYLLERMHNINPKLTYTTAGVFYAHNLDAPDAVRFIEYLNDPAKADWNTHDLLGRKAARNPKLYGSKANPFSFRESYQVVLRYINRVPAIAPSKPTNADNGFSYLAMDN